MFLMLILSLSLVLLFWVYVRWKRVANFWKDRGVPNSAPHPILGSLTFIQKISAAEWMRNIYVQFDGAPYVGIWLFWRPALVINCPNIARNILIKDADNFRDRFVNCGKNDPIGARTLFIIKDPLWTQIRRQMTPLYNPTKLRALQGLFLSKSKQLTERIGEEMNKNDAVELRTVFADYTTDVISIASFGVDSNSIVDKNSAIRTVTKEFMRYSFWRGLGYCSIFFFPELTNIFNCRFFPKDTTDYLTKLFRAMVQQRGGYNSNNNENKNLLDILLKIKRDADKNNEEIDETFLVAQAAVFLQGGFDTSAVSLTFAMYELAFQPHIQEKMYEELIEAKKGNEDKDSEEKVLSELVYLNCVIKETLRKYPPMGWLDRIANKTYKIDENLTIPAGTPIYINGNGMQYDPEYYPDPEKFEPDRFLPENEKNIDPMTFIPFGGGPRICIGQRFAYHTIGFALASIVLNYKIRPVPNCVKPSDCPLEKKGLFIMPANDVYMKFIPRKQS